MVAMLCSILVRVVAGVLTALILSVLLKSQMQSGAVAASC